MEYSWWYVFFTPYQTDDKTCSVSIVSCILLIYVMWTLFPLFLLAVGSILSDTCLYQLWKAVVMGLTATMSFSLLTGVFYYHSLVLSLKKENKMGGKWLMTSKGEEGRVKIISMKHYLERRRNQSIILPDRRYVDQWTFINITLIF